MSASQIELFLPFAVRAALAAGREILDVYAGADSGVEYKSDRSPLTLADRRAQDVIRAGLASAGIPILSEEGRLVPYAERRKWNIFWLVDPLDGTKEFLKKNGEFTVNIALVETGRPILGVVLAPVLGELYAGSREFGAFKVEIEALGKSDISPLTIAAAGKKLPIAKPRGPLKIVASRSHMTPETAAFIEKLRSEHGDAELVSKGSSLKICLVAEGAADVYPRFGPTMEWDTAAGHAVAAAASCRVTQADGLTPLVYNKEDLRNPWFIVRAPAR